MSNRVRSIIITLAILIGGFMIMKVLQAQKEIPVRKDVPKQANDEKTLTVKLSDIPTNIRIGGTVSAYNQIQVYAEVSGVLKSTSKSFRTGNRFNKGDVLLHIDDDVYRNNVMAQKSSFLNQISTLIPDLALDYPESAKKWENYLNNFSMEKALAPLPQTTNSKEKYYITSRNIYNLYYSVKSMEETLDKYTINAPFSGVVTESNVTPGTLIRSGQVLGEFTNTDLYEIEVPIGIADVQYLKKGNPVLLQSEDIEGNFEGVIQRINDKIDRSSQTVKVYIQSKDSRLKDGMYVSAEIQGAPVASALKVPAKWLVDGNNIYVKNGEDFSLKEIQVVRNENDFVILHGLQNGMVIMAQEKTYL